MKTAASAIVFIFLTFVTFAAGAATLDAVGAPDAPGLYELAKPVLEALVHGQYAVSAALSLVLAAALARRYGGAIPKIGPKVAAFLSTDAGGALLVFWGSLGGAAATALAAGQVPSLALVWTATKVAFAAAGGYSMAKRLAVPLVEWAAARAPAWTHPLFDVVLWIFGRSAAIAKAELAGSKAVVDNPPTGAAGVVGERRDLE